jgi:hypothetical protein
MRLAARIAINRMVAGAHTPAGTVAGFVLGMTLGEYLVQRCQGGGTYDAWSFDGNRFPGTQDFVLTDLFDFAQSRQIEQAGYGVTREETPPALGAKSPILEQLWKNARAEWR